MGCRIVSAILRIEFKRVFHNKLFWISLGIGCLLAVLVYFTSNAWRLTYFWNVEYKRGLLTQKLPSMSSALNIWMLNKGRSNQFNHLFFLILPILTAIPCGASFYNDKESGLINQIVSRVNKKFYFLSKLIVYFLCGGCIAIVPVLLNLIMCMCSLPMGTPVYSTMFFLVKNNCVLSQMFFSKPILYILIYFVFMFFMFGILNCTTLLFSYLANNMFIVLLIPFTIYFSTYVFFLYCMGVGQGSLVGAAYFMSFSKDGVPAVGIQLVLLVIVSILFVIKHRDDVL